LATKRTRPNRYKPESKPVSDGTPNAAAGNKNLFRMISWVFMLAMMSLGAIYTHDAIVQSPFFTVTEIEIKGNHRVAREEILARTGLKSPANLFDLHLPALEKRLVRHPWVESVNIRRRLFSSLEITIEEQKPLAIVNIENLADVIINSEGSPFKEYEPGIDSLPDLPVISGVDLSLSDKTYLFKGELFNAVMDLLEIKGLSQIETIHGDENIGLTIKILDIYNKKMLDIYDKRFYKENTDEIESPERGLMPIKLGFDRFAEKLARAEKISRYMEVNFPSKTILAMDLYDIEKIFVKTEDALHNTLEKGV